MHGALAIGLLSLLLAGCGDGDGGVPDADTSGLVDCDCLPDGPDVDPLIGIGEVEVVDTGYQFLEGPQWRDGQLLFTDIPANTIYALTPPTTIAPFRTPSGNANGLAVTAAGALLAAEHGNRRISITEADAIEALVERFEGDRLNSPNDVIAREDGTVYFTDPPYGIDDAQRELDFMGVFRVAPGGAITAEWRGPLTSRPNGIALSPDASVLYVADTAQGVVRAWDVAGDGALSGERTISSDVPGADGMAVDAAGNLFVTTSAGVRVLAPDGTVWGTIAVAQQPANCAFGDADARTLYITARTALYRVRLASPGLPTR